MLFYASLLMAFFKNNRLASKRNTLKSVLGPIPNPLLDGILSRYTETQLTSTRQDAKTKNVCTARCQDKVACYLFVLCLILDDFSVDINLLAQDLQMKPQTYYPGRFADFSAIDLFKTVGCKVTALSDATEIERRGITKSEAKTYKLAKLKCPPEFPRIRRRQAPGKRK
jgi:DNA-directed RNA polymerase I subunit RPA49